MVSNGVPDERPEADDVSTVPQSDYLDRLMRRASFEALWPLFTRAQRPAKELTESYSALVHLRPFLASGGPYRVVHVGDGAHARTAAMFALKTTAENVSVDPELNVPLIEEWRDRFAVRRFDWRKAPIQDVAAELDALPEMPTLVTFVHAHISVDYVLGMFRWDAAFTLSCCSPGKQLTQKLAIEKSGEDASVLSPGRSYQVLVNRR
jgi:hypothetical protein